METEKLSLHQKLLMFQKNVTPVKKDGVNPHFGKKYATLTNILAEIKPVLSDLGLIVVQPVLNDHVFTRIIDSESGEALEGSIQLPSNLTSQGIGSAITYYRRYLIAGMLSLEIEDDDGNDASGKNSQQKQQKKTDNRPALTDARFQKALDRIQKGEADVYEKTLAAFQVTAEQKTQLQLAAGK